MTKADKDDDKLISVASRVHTSVIINEPPEDPENPGLMPEGQSLTLHGSSHPLAKNGEMVNHGVNARIFRRWHAAQKAVNAPIADHLSEVADDYQGNDHPTMFGWEPALEAMSGDPAARAGSTITHKPPVTASEMAATSDTPADDSPRSEPDFIPVKRSQESASSTISEKLKDKK